MSYFTIYDLMAQCSLVCPLESRVKLNVSLDRCWKRMIFCIARKDTFVRRDGTSGVD